jgi:hypothetical protein
LDLRIRRFRLPGNALIRKRSGMSTEREWDSPGVAVFPVDQTAGNM